MIKRSFNPWAASAAAVILSVLMGTSPVAAQTEGASLDDASRNQLVSIGRLIRSGTARNGTPRFALLDDDGEITAYVVPATDVSVAQHLNQSVAVTARTVSHDPDGLPYLLAHRIAPVAAAGGDPDIDVAVDEPRIVVDGQEGESSSQASSRAVALESARGVRHTPSGRARPIRDSAVLPAARHLEVEEELIEPGPLYPQAAGDDLLLDEFPLDHGSCGNPNCADCAPCGPCTDHCCPCGPAGRYWLRVDYLAWASKAMDMPPLVTTSPSGTPVQDAGVLGVEGTQVLFGGGDSDSLSRSGVRFVLGGWLDPCQRHGLEVDYYFLDQDTETFRANSFGDPILARPFYNTQLSMEDSELVAYPGIVSGTVAVTYDTELQSLAPRYRYNLCCENFLPMACGGLDGCAPPPCGPVGGSRLDLTLGYRYLKLDEGLQITEDLISENDNTFATFNLRDAFDATNEFHGFELGLVWDRYQGRWSMELASRFSMGNNSRSVAINGGTTSMVQGAVFRDVGGLLALPSNIGTYTDDEFVVIPEFSLTLGYQIAPRMRFLVGYTILYWTNVVRPGDQIDLNVNPDLLPPAIDTTGMLAPTFAMNDTTFWAQGVNLGLDWRW